ncbi:MAG: LPS assembly lipoprotein LptE [Lysobacter sp.]|nr:LPS assembly lipoprotein LptE [Lysobacter sp.]
MRGATLVTACLLLSACGFQLRGEATMGLASLHVSTEAPSQVATEIRRRISGSTVKLVADPKEAEAHLRILSENTEKSIQTLTGAGRVYDYQLRLRVGFRASDGAGNPLVEPTVIEVRRVITYSETAPLAKEAEELLLFEDMRGEVAGQILRRIAVLNARLPAR